ncbi:response regulator [Chloroflexota bacterium]
MNTNAGTTTTLNTIDTIKVVLVDDHELARQGVRKLLNSDTSIKIIGEAADYSKAVYLIDQLEPDVVLLDIRLEKGNGIDVAKFIRANMPQIKILVLTAYNDEQYVRAMARIGVRGYLIKTVSAEQLIRAIRDVAEGGLIFPADVSTTVISLLQNNGRDNAIEIRSNQEGSCKPVGVIPHNRCLTSREAEILQYISCGMRNHEVASSMGIAVKTVEVHVRHILRKLGARNRIQAMLNANMDKWQ